mmetsp:Transcript_10410/g.42100  ORF Transcript_10410/g.42100 Transcript_10410/m.42100 type:complete len:280 (+) Transcript_10410:25-864(+)
MARRAATLVVGGLPPCAVVAWEAVAYYEKTKRALSTPHRVTFPEGSQEWTIERDASTCDLLLTKRSPWPSRRQGPLAALAAWASSGGRAPPESVGAIVVDPGGAPAVLEADVDGSVSLRPLAERMTDPDAVELTIRPLAWPRAERDRIEKPANLFATAAKLQCGGHGGALGVRAPWRSARDERFAPVFYRGQRPSWPTVAADAALPEKLDRAVSPSAALVLELYATVGLIPRQHKGRAMLASDFAPGSDPPLRKGARFGPPIAVRVENYVVIKPPDDER